jgi:hypothetical protein
VAVPETLHLQAIDDRVPDDPPRSQLAAFAPLILRWRRRSSNAMRRSSACFSD